MIATIDKPKRPADADAPTDYDLLMQSLTFQCDYAQRVLGIEEAEIADVLRDMAEWYADDRSQWQTAGGLP